MKKQPDTAYLINACGLTHALVGFYDTPTIDGFSNVVEKRGCLFSSFQDWQHGKMTHISRLRPGCIGSAYWLCGQQCMTHEDFLDFLVTTEGLKPDVDSMQLFLDHHKPYAMEHHHLIIGPLVAEHYCHCKTVTFFCNPDQLSALLIGVNYDHLAGTESRLLPGNGPGCHHIAGIFPDLNKEYAAIGSTDIAMRLHLPSDILSLTVTIPLFEKLCALDDDSFFCKPFWKRLTRYRLNIQEESAS